MDLKEEGCPSPIQTSDADLLSGPETAEDLVSGGPQSMRSASSVKTATSAKSEASVVKPEASSTETTSTSGKPSAASPTMSLQGFVLSASPKGSEAGSGRGTLKVFAAAAAAPSPILRQEEDNEEEEAAGNAALEPDLDSALSAPRKKPRTGAPADPGGNENGMGGGVGSVASAGRANRGHVEAATHAGPKDDWGGVTEGMFRKRVSEDLKSMLRECGGSCGMVEVAGAYKKHHNRLLDLQGKKLRVLLTTKGGLYGIRLRGTGQDAVIELKESAARKKHGPLAADPDTSGAGDRSGTLQLTRTVVNPDAVWNDHSSPRSLGSPDAFGGSRRNTRSAAIALPPDARKSLSYVNRLADAEDAAGLRRRDVPPVAGHSRGEPFGNRHAGEANVRRGGDWRVRGGWSRSRSRSRSQGRRRSRSISRNRRDISSRDAGGRSGGNSGRGEGTAGAGGRSGRRFPSENRRFSHTARRRGSSPQGLRYSSPPQRRRTRSPSPSPPNRGERRLGDSRNRQRSHSRGSRRKSSPPRRASPARRNSPLSNSRRRGSSPKNSRSPRESSPPSRRRRNSPPSRKSSPPRRQSAERGGRDRGSRDRDRGETREEYARDGGARPAVAGRDRRERLSPAAPARAVEDKRRLESARHEVAAVSRGDGAARPYGYRGRPGDQAGAPPPRGYGNASPAANYAAAPVTYASDPVYGNPKVDRRGEEIGRSAHGGGGVAGRRAMDPIIPLARDGAPIPPEAAVSGRPSMVEGAAGGVGGLLSSNDSSRQQYHTAVGQGDYPAANGGMTRRDWAREDGGSGAPAGQMVGLDRSFLASPHPAPAMLPPPSSLRPIHLPAGRAQGARLMIKGTHPAVPERRIHALASAFGIVGKIEVLEGFVFVHMKSLEEASRAVAGLNGTVIPNVCPHDPSGGGSAPLLASIWREEMYQALMSRENMRIYADSMRRASTWYEKQTKSGFVDVHGDRMPCRFFALGRGCIFGNNCGFSHEQLPQQRSRGAVKIHGGPDGGPSFASPPLSKRQPLLPSPSFEPGSDARGEGAPLPHRQERVPVLAYDGQSRPLNFVHREEAHRQPALGAHEGLGAQGGHKPAFDRSVDGVGVGVARPWQPEHGARAAAGPAAGFGQAVVSDRASLLHAGISDGRSVDHQQPRRGNVPSEALGSSEPRRDGPSRTHVKDSDKARRGGGGGGGSGDADGAGGSRRGGSHNGGEGQSMRRMLHDRKRSRERGKGRDVSSTSASRRDSRSRLGSANNGSERQSSPRRSNQHRTGPRRSSPRRSNSRRTSPRRGSPRRTSGGLKRSSAGRGSIRDAGWRPGGGDSRNRGRERRDDATDRGSRRHRREDSSAQRQSPFSRSNSRRRRHRGDGGGDRREPSPARDKRAPGSRRGRDSVSPVMRGRRHGDTPSMSPRGKARGYDGEGVDYELDDRQLKRGRYERGNARGRGIDGGSQREESEDKPGSFAGRAGGRREGSRGGHGWAPLAHDPGPFSPDSEGRSFGLSPRDVSDGGFHGGWLPDGVSRSRHGSPDWEDDHMSGGLMQPEGSPGPPATKFTITTRLDSMPPPFAEDDDSPGRPATKFSITMPSDIATVLGPTAASGVRRTGLPPSRGRGRGRGGRFGNNMASRRPLRGSQYDDGDSNNSY